MKRIATIAVAVLCALSGVVLLLAHDNIGFAVLMLAQQLLHHAPNNKATP